MIDFAERQVRITEIVMNQARNEHERRIMIGAELNLAAGDVVEVQDYTIDIVDGYAHRTPARTREGVVEYVYSNGYARIILEDEFGKFVDVIGLDRIGPLG